MPSWTYKSKPLTETPEGKVGFLYLITHSESGKKYVGKKLFVSRRTLPPLKGRSRKRHVIKESDWKSYLSSSKYVQADMELYGEEAFTFEILEVFEDRGELNFAELKYMVFNSVLDAVNEKGDRAYNNENIARTIYASRTPEILEARLAFDLKYKN